MVTEILIISRAIAANNPDVFKQCLRINTITAGVIVTSSILIIEFHIYAAHLFSDQNFRIISTTLRIIY